MDEGQRSSGDFSTRPDHAHNRPTCGSRLSNRIELREPLGQGGYGEVWLAWTGDIRRPGERIAVKFLKPEYSQDPDQCERFRRSIEIAGRIRIPGICRVLEHDHHDQFGPWAAMEYADGLPLQIIAARIQEEYGRISVRDLRAILGSLSSSVDALHRGESGTGGSADGIVHGDLTMANVVTIADNSDGTFSTKIVDFGLAFLTSEPERAPRGFTRGYAAPEQVNRRSFGPAADRYSLAVVAYELLTGRKPYADSGPHSPGDRPFPVPTIPGADAVFRQALHYHPEERFASCREFTERILRCLTNPGTVPSFGPQHPVVGFQTGLRDDVSRHAAVFRQTRDNNAATTGVMGTPEDIKQRRDALAAQMSDVEERLNRLTQRRDQLNGPIRIGIFGSRNAGKSTLFAAWYWFRGELDSIDLVIEDESRDYLAGLAEELMSPEGIRATPTIKPQVLKMKANAHGRQWQIETRDFTGEFLAAVTAGEELSQAARDAREFLASADLIVVMPQRDESDQQLLDSIDQIFDSPRREVMLLLSKFDTYDFQGNSDKEFLDYFHQLLNRKSALASVYNKLRQSVSETRRLSVIPLSSTGGIEPAADGSVALRPFQIFVPLLYATRNRLQELSELSGRVNTVSAERNQCREQLNSRQAEWEDLHQKIRSQVEKGRRRFQTARSRTPVAVDQLESTLGGLRKIRRHYRRKYQLDAELNDLNNLIRTIEKTARESLSIELRRIENDFDSQLLWEQLWDSRDSLLAIKRIRDRCDPDGDHVLRRQAAGLTKRIQMTRVRTASFGIAGLLGFSVLFYLITRIFS